MTTRSDADSSEKAHWDAYTRVIDQLAAEIDEFENLRDGNVQKFDLGSLDDLGEVLIKARIAKGWTHRDLGDALGVSQQVIQRDEARNFENCGLARLAELMDALGYVFEGHVRPKEAGPAPRSGVSISSDVVAPGPSVDHHWPPLQVQIPWTNWVANIDDWSKAAGIANVTMKWTQAKQARSESLPHDGDVRAE